MLLRRVLRRRLVRVSIETEVLRGGGIIEGAYKALRRQTHALSQSTTPFACTLLRGGSGRDSLAVVRHTGLLSW